VLRAIFLFVFFFKLYAFISFFFKLYAFILLTSTFLFVFFSEKKGSILFKEYVPYPTQTHGTKAHQPSTFSSSDFLNDDRGFGGID